MLEKYLWSRTKVDRIYIAINLVFFPKPVCQEGAYIRGFVKTDIVFPKRVCREGAYLRGSVQRKIHISEKLKLPLRCLSKIFCQTKTTLSQQKVCCKGANLRGFVNTKILLQKPMPRTCQSKRLCQQQDAFSKNNAANVPIYRAAPVACFSCFWYSNCVVFEGNTTGDSISLGILA